MNPRKTSLLAALLALFLVLGGSLTASAQGNDEIAQMERFIELMQSYLSTSEQWMGMVSNEESSIYLAIEGIVEIYEERGERQKAVEHLRGVLEKHGDSLTVRTAVRFKIRDLYKDGGQGDKALAELDRIIEENSR